jgi:hypothetical protein
MPLDAARDALTILQGQLMVAPAARNAALETRNAQLETRVAGLEERLARLRDILSRPCLMLALTRAMSRSPPATPTRAPRCAREGPARTWTARHPNYILAADT